jgi:hypothetical protein
MKSIRRDLEELLEQQKLQIFGGEINRQRNNSVLFLIFVIKRNQCNLNFCRFDVFSRIKPKIDG